MTMLTNYHDYLKYANTQVAAEALLFGDDGKLICIRSRGSGRFLRLPRALLL